MLRGETRTRSASVLLFSVFVLGVVVPPATAHYVYQSERVAKYDGQCVWNRSEISHGTNDGGYSKVNLTFDSDGTHTACSSLYNTFTKARIEINLGYSQDGSTGWGTCAKVGPIDFNNSYYNYKEKLEKYWSRPCGPGYYRTIGGVWGYKDAGWRGGHVNSTKHKLPS
jgi:hypothetical protein